MKKPKKRYLTANQIRDEIDAYKKRCILLQSDAEKLEFAAKEMAKHPTLREEVAWKRSEAKRLRRKVNRIIEIRLPKLKDKLAEWTTDLLPGVITDGDRSIQA